MSMTKRSIFAGLGMFPATVLLLLSIPLLFIGVRKCLQTVNAQGVVIDHEYRIVPDPEGSRSTYLFYDPVVKFTTIQGEVFTFPEEINVESPTYEVGDFVDILYDPGNPSEAIIRSWSRYWQEPIYYLVLGFIPFIVLIPWGIWTYMKGRRDIFTEPD